MGPNEGAGGRGRQAKWSRLGFPVMCGRGRGRAKAAIGLAAMLVLSACQSGDVEALPPEEDVVE